MPAITRNAPNRDPVSFALFAWVYKMSTLSGNETERVSPVWVEWIAFGLIVMGIAVAVAVLLGSAAILLASLAEAAETPDFAAMPHKVEVSAIMSTRAPVTPVSEVGTPRL